MARSLAPCCSSTVGVTAGRGTPGLGWARPWAVVAGRVGAPHHHPGPPHQHPSVPALSHTPGIPLGVNETLHHQFTLVSTRSLPVVFWSGCRPPELSAALLGSGWVGTRPWGGGVHSSEVGVVPPCCQPGMAMGYPAAVLCLLGPLTHQPSPWVSGCSKGAGCEPPVPAEVQSALPLCGPD